MKHSGVQATKHIYMALINAYAACGQFERAKQVIFIVIWDLLAVEFFIHVCAPIYPAIVFSP
jgi:hypothetical protein